MLGAAEPSDSSSPLESSWPRLGLGSGQLGAMDERSAFRVLDEWVRLGGRLVDTARVYSGGRSEEVIGAWMTARRYHEHVLVLTKGGHPDGEWKSRLVRPAIMEDLQRSLSALRRDRIDVYMLHRDDPTVPVGELIELLNEPLATGLIRSIGASNWTPDRYDEANGYAVRHGLVGFTLASNQYGLAPPVGQLLPGTLSSNDPTSRLWLRQSQTQLVAWSVLSGGYFGRDEKGARSLDAGPYDSPDNRERRRRAALLAQRKGISVPRLVIAWVLGQPFAPVALIGARTVDHLADSWRAHEVVLSQREMDWLDLRPGARDQDSTESAAPETF
jgi:1-deoxyxylulose-5-phosphate synthase